MAVPEVEDSILKTIKDALMLDPSETAFDQTLIMHINSSFATLNQLGVGPTDGFKITGDTETWTTYLADEDLMDSVRTLVYIKVRLIFDPPPTSFGITAFQEQAKELEVRLNIRREERDHPWEPILIPSSLEPEDEL